MSDPEIRTPQHIDPPKPDDQSKVPVPPKQDIPSGQPKMPQPAQEKHDQEKKKPA